MLGPIRYRHASTTHCYTPRRCCQHPTVVSGTYLVSKPNNQKMPSSVRSVQCGSTPAPVTDLSTLWWNVNQPKHQWVEECPAYLIGQSEKNISILMNKDDDVKRFSWEKCQDLVRTYTTLLKLVSCAGMQRPLASSGKHLVFRRIATPICGHSSDLHARQGPTISSTSNAHLASSEGMCNTSITSQRHTAQFSGT